MKKHQSIHTGYIMYAFIKKGVIYCMDDQMKVLGQFFRHQYDI